MQQGWERESSMRTQERERKRQKTLNIIPSIDCDIPLWDLKEGPRNRRPHHHHQLQSSLPRMTFYLTSLPLYSLSIQKVTPDKKVTKMKNQFFHARQPRAKSFDFCIQQQCILALFCQNFDIAAPYHF